MSRALKGVGGINMKDGVVQVYYGTGSGKTTAAIGQCIKAAGIGAQVIMIQFLKGKDTNEYQFMERLEPEIKMFRFEKESESYLELTKEQQKDEKANILNGFHFAKKVLETRGCDLLLLDEILGLVDLNIIAAGELIELIEAKAEDCSLILTGRKFSKELEKYADIISEICNKKG